MASRGKKRTDLKGGGGFVVEHLTGMTVARWSKGQCGAIKGTVE